ncbi:XRE family transcriptional regulator [Pseudomonas oryzihabitans]|nr:MATE family efflux transporter [Pseudomonas psychrotolerans]KTS79604.1 XRE family transcriptional regulator [Pseudomonas psychrotolerans]KTS96386.1 XRE family transcriptional regulator [Pseudomonas psychrotolerans]KTT58160.1 XRE family transcriptional regulator [Pseudomonas psychrotolerans]KTT64019.1 XRE family transcriptional regulator [Pseudomonas psychrotolerans]
MSSLLADWRHPELHRRVWALAAPMILSNLSVPLVTLVDSAIAGHLPEARQLAAVAMGGAFYTALLGILAFLRMGTTGFAAQASGRADGAALRQILLQAGLLGLGLSLVLLLVASLALDPLLTWLGLDPAFAELASHFLHLRLLGLPAALLSYAVIGWLLGTQDARTPLVLLLTTNALNLVLVTGLVLGLGAGVQGIALASVLAEWGGVLLGLWLVIRRLRQWPGRVDRTALRRLASWRPLLAVNRDIFIRSLALQAVFLLFAAQGAQLGETTVAANALLLNGLLVTAFALDGLAHAVEALSGHALGARQGIILRRVLVIAGGWSLLASLVFALAFALFGDVFVAWQSDIVAVRQEAHAYLPYLALLPLIAMASYLLDGLFIGATRAREMRNAMLLALLLALPLGWLLRGLGNHGLWLAFLTFMALRGLISAALAWRLAEREGWLSERPTT